MATAKHGDTVSIDYTIHTADGTVVGNTEQTGPQVLTIGQSEIFPQIEAALTGMEVGNKETITIDSANAFGPRRPEMVIDIPLAHLPPQPAPEPGMALQAQQQDGTQLTLFVVEVGTETVKADGNHPLAGEDLTFGLTLREITQAS